MKQLKSKIFYHVINEVVENFVNNEIGIENLINISTDDDRGYTTFRVWYTEEIKPKPKPGDIVEWAEDLWFVSKKQDSVKYNEVFLEHIDWNKNTCTAKIEHLTRIYKQRIL